MKRGTYIILVWILSGIAAFLFLDFGARYAVYLHDLYKSYKMMAGFYDFKGSFRDYKKEYERQQGAADSDKFIQSLIADRYNRKYFNPLITGHNYGFYQKAVAPKPAEGIVRILCLGTSTVQAGFPSALQKELDRVAPKKYEVVNAGISNTTLLNIFMNYILIWKRLDPAVVIIEYNVDEPSYSAERNLDLIEDPRGLESFEAFNKFDTPPKGSYNGPGAGILRLIAVVSEELTKEEEEEGELLDRPPEGSLLSYEILLENLIHLVKGSGAIPVLVTYQPAFSDNENRGNFTGEFYSRLIYFYRNFFSRYSVKGAMRCMDSLNEIMRELAKKNSVILVETVGSIPRQDEYFLDGTHHSEKANEIVARKILDALSEHSVIEHGSSD